MRPGSVRGHAGIVADMEAADELLEKNRTARAFKVPRATAPGVVIEPCLTDRQCTVFNPALSRAGDVRWQSDGRIQFVAKC